MDVFHMELTRRAEKGENGEPMIVSCWEEIIPD